MKRNVRSSKFEPLVDEVELLTANPQYVHVRLKSGKETTVSLRHLAPLGGETTEALSVEGQDLNAPISVDMSVPEPQNDDILQST